VKSGREGQHPDLMSSVFELYKGSTHHIPRSSDRKQLSSGISSIFHGIDSAILSVKFQMSELNIPPAATATPRHAELFSPSTIHFETNT
jgi:hypothetical protein